MMILMRSNLLSYLLGYPLATLWRYSLSYPLNYPLGYTLNYSINHTLYWKDLACQTNYSLIVYHGLSKKKFHFQKRILTTERKNFYNRKKSFHIMRTIFTTKNSSRSVKRILRTRWINLEMRKKSQKIMVLHNSTISIHFANKSYLSFHEKQNFFHLVFFSTRSPEYWGIRSKNILDRPSHTEYYTGF